jgi:type IV secretion system protein TrbG
MNRRNYQLWTVVLAIAVTPLCGQERPRNSASPDPAVLHRIEKELTNPAGDPPAIKDSRAAFQAKAEAALTGVTEADPPLPQAAKAALSTAEPWKEDVQVPAQGKDGRVLYSFGAGLATVVCAPLRVCVVELQPGEMVQGEPHIGDAVRWNVSPAMSGSGSSAINLVVIKPKEANLDTTMVIPTNRRAYYLRLVSRPQQYIPLIAFSYPDDDAARWKRAIAEQDRTKEEFEASRITPVDSMSNLNFDYEIGGGSEHLRPLRVLDDGKKTYIQMPPGTAAREAPVLVVAGLDDSAEMVNYRFKGSLYVVDRLFDHGALLLGGGKKQQRVDIVRVGSGVKVGKHGGKGKDAIETAYLKRKAPEEPISTNDVKEPAAAPPATK